VSEQRVKRKTLEDWKLKDSNRNLEDNKSMAIPKIFLI